MRASFVVRLLLAAVLALAAILALEPVTSAQGGGRQSPPRPSTDLSLDLGTINGSTYSNRFFGISFRVPKGWTILDVGAMKAMRDNAKGLLREEKDTVLKRELEASVDRTTPLLSASKLPPGTTGSFHAVLVCAAERIPTAIIKTPRDFYTTLLNSFKLAQGVDVEVIEPFRARKTGVQDFGIYTLKVTSSAGIVMQKHIVMIKSPYAFAIVLNYTEESDAAFFDGVVNSVDASQGSFD